MMLFLARWLLIVVLLTWWIGMSLLAAGCTKYVPVEVQLPGPKAPPECETRFVKPRAIRPIPVEPDARKAVCGEASLPVCLAKLWAKRELEWQASVRRKEAADAVCRSFTSQF